MRILHLILRKLPLVFYLSAGQEIRREGLLHEYLSNVFLVAQHPVNGGDTPLRFARNSLNAVRLQILFDLPDSVALNVQLKDFSNNLRFLRDNLQLTIGAFCVAEKLRVVEKRPATLHPAAHPELHILTMGLALRLGQCGVLVNHTVTGGQSIESADFKVNSNIHLF